MRFERTGKVVGARERSQTLPADAWRLNRGVLQGRVTHLPPQQAKLADGMRLVVEQNSDRTTEGTVADQAAMQRPQRLSGSLVVEPRDSLQEQRPVQPQDGARRYEQRVRPLTPTAQRSSLADSGTCCSGCILDMALT